MKKVLALLLMMVLVVSFCSVSVFAAPSAEAQGVISGVTVTDKNNKEVEVVFEKIETNVAKDFYTALVGLRDEKKDSSLKIIGHYDIVVKEDNNEDLSVVLNVLGISKASKVYILLQKGKEIISVTPEVFNNQLKFTLEEGYEKLAIVTDGKTASKVEKENQVLSPQTSDATAYVVFFALISMLAIAVLPKKIKNV